MSDKNISEEIEDKVDLDDYQSELVNVNPEDFNWDSFEQGLDAEAQEGRKTIAAMYDETLNNLNQSKIVTGKVVRMTDKEVIVDINAKSEGVISLNEFRYNQDLKLNDEVEVMVDMQEDKTGQLVLSHRKARVLKAWDQVITACDTQEIVTGFVKCRTKGGMIVDIFGIEAFLPGSQMDVKPIKDYDAYVNKTMEFIVVKVNHEYKNVVVSHKALIEADIEDQKKDIIAQLEKGQVLEGVVKNITSYGVFIDLGGVDGLIHITDLSWSRINHPEEMLEVDQKLNVVILDFDDEKTRIQLGLKQLEPHPWEALDNNMAVGDKVTGKVVVLADYGAFVEITPGVEGLIHVSEMSWSTHLRSAGDFVKVGDSVEAQILTLDREERKMSLGMKQLVADPWTDITTKYPIGSKHKGKVRNFTNFGVFLELEEGVDGLIYISDLSWTKKIKHPSEFCALGEEMEVIVLELDVEGRKLSLGHKQLQENPWDQIQEKYAINSDHELTVTSVFDKGATIDLEEAGEKVEAFIPSRHLEKEDGSKLAKGDTATFKVIEFNKEFKRIVLSHMATFKAEEKKAVAEAMNKSSKKVEKSTLGDLDALAELKKKLENN